MKRIITVQHPESEDQIQQMVSSWTDWTLTDTGRAQADAIGHALKTVFSGTKFTLYCSDLTRARETAEQIGKYFYIDPITRTGLRDLHAGSGTGKPLNWLQLNQLPADSAPGALDYRLLEDAESYREMLRRVRVVLDEVLALPEENVLVVAHGKALSLFHFLWVFGSPDVFDYFKFDGIPGGVSVLFLDDEGNRSMQKLNDLSYAQSARP